MKILSNSPAPVAFRGRGGTGSDLPFTGKYAIQGNYRGPVIWDISNPAAPVMVTAYTCPASQNDVSVANNLMFVSSEGYNGRVDCMTGGIPQADSVSKERFRGVRIFEISDIKYPGLVTQVQTCRGSHTHTVVEVPNDPDNVYVYVSGLQGTRSAASRR